MVAVVALVPASLVTVLSYRASSRTVTERVGASIQRAAIDINDIIDRNLFERYGDVQAFATNPLLQDRRLWYQRGSAHNPIADAANQYVQLYGLYALTIAVDREGRVLAVNDKDAAGKTVDTAWLYDQNFAEASWFKQTTAERYLKAQDSALTGGRRPAESRGGARLQRRPSRGDLQRTHSRSGWPRDRVLAQHRHARSRRGHPARPVQRPEGRGPDDGGVDRAGS